MEETLECGTKKQLSTLFNVCTFNIAPAFARELKRCKTNCLGKIRRLKTQARLYDTILDVHAMQATFQTALGDMSKEPSHTRKRAKRK